MLRYNEWDGPTHVCCYSNEAEWGSLRVKTYCAVARYWGQGSLVHYLFPCRLVLSFRIYILADVAQETTNTPGYKLWRGDRSTTLVSAGAFGRVGRRAA